MTLQCQLPLPPSLPASRPSDSPPSQETSLTMTQVGDGWPVSVGRGQ